MGLYQKHRPSKLSDVVGNDSTKKQLEVALKSKEGLPHAMLFYGPRGCGKTTLGRIVANMLGCSKTDFQELDAADFRGIDSMRSIRRKVHYRPMEGPVRVWLLDEVHAVTNEGQDAILKVLEDTPAHVYFILCTTNPEKLKPTIRSRVAQFPVQELDEKELLQVLKRVCVLEEMRPSMDLLKHIASSSMGASRDALVVLEQVINLDPEEQMASVERLVGEAAAVNELCQLLLKNASWKQLAGVVEKIKDDPETVRRSVLGYMSVVLRRSGNGRAYSIMENFSANYYDLGKAGLDMSCWECCNG